MALRTPGSGRVSLQRAVRSDAATVSRYGNPYADRDTHSNVNLNPNPNPDTNAYAHTDAQPCGLALHCSADHARRRLYCRCRNLL